MERIINYDELPRGNGQSVYLRMESDPNLYLYLLSKNYKVISNIKDANDETIYVTGRRQDRIALNFDDYKNMVDSKIQTLLKKRNIVKPNTVNFSLSDLVNHKYKVPFVLKNENRNGGKEKFLIATEEDYDNLLFTCDFLLSNQLFLLPQYNINDPKFKIDYESYLENNFKVQEYIKTPTDFNTTVRLLTSSSNDLLYGSLKYNEPETLKDETTLVGYLLGKIYPLSTPSIVSNTLSGGKNILLFAQDYKLQEKELIDLHKIESDKFHELVHASQDVHELCKSELGIICGFDYIYDESRDKWFLLEYHSKPMVGDYSIRQGIDYETRDDRLTADGRVRATALSLTLKKTR